MESVAEHSLCELQGNAILRTLRARETRLYRREIQLESVGEHRIRSVIRAEQPLELRVRFDKLNLSFVAAGESEILDRLGVDREEAHRCAVFRRHVRDGCAIR